MSDLTIENYSDKSFVVRGETKPHKDKLKELQGKWNSNLTGGGGWIFSNKHREAVNKYLNSLTENPVEETPTETKISSKSKPVIKTVAHPAVKIASIPSHPSQSQPSQETLCGTLRETIEKDQDEKALLTQGLFVFLPLFEDENGTKLNLAKGKFQSERMQYWTGKRPDFNKAKTVVTLVLSFSNDTVAHRINGKGFVNSDKEVTSFVLEEKEEESEVEESE